METIINQKRPAQPRDPEGKYARRNPFTLALNHKHTVLTISLAVALVAPVAYDVAKINGYFAAEVEASPVTKSEPVTLEQVLEQRAHEIYEADFLENMEKARQEALMEQLSALQNEIYDSPYLGQLGKGGEVLR